MFASTMGPIVPPRHFRSRKQPQPPRVAACHLWATGQFGTHQLAQQYKTASTTPNSGNGSKLTQASNVLNTWQMGQNPPATAVQTVKKANAPSTTNAPLFPDMILKNLYISDLETARAVLSPHYAAPGRPNIRYILTVLKDDKKAPTIAEEARQSQYILKCIKVGDHPDVNLLQHLPDAIDFIKDALARDDGGVLVHCRKGVSRSGTVIVACVMELLRLDLNDALAFCIKQRSKILPNDGFKYQLQLWKDLSFSLVDEEGQEKAEYLAWKNSKVFKEGGGHTLTI